MLSFIFQNDKCYLAANGTLLPFSEIEVIAVVLPEVESILGNVLAKTNVVWHPKKFKAHKKVKSTTFHITLCSTSQPNSTLVEVLFAVEKNHQKNQKSQKIV